MSVSIDYMLFCDEASNDENTRKPNLKGLFDWIHVSSVPIKVHMFVFARAIGQANAPFQWRLEIMKPDGTELGGMDLGGTTDVTGSSQLFVELNVDFPAMGAYMFDFRNANGSLSSRRLELKPF